LGIKALSARGWFAPFVARVGADLFVKCIMASLDLSNMSEREMLSMLRPPLLSQDVQAAGSAAGDCLAGGGPHGEIADAAPVLKASHGRHEAHMGARAFSTYCDCPFKDGKFHFEYLLFLALGCLMAWQAERMRAHLEFARARQHGRAGALSECSLTSASFVPDQGTWLGMGGAAEVYSAQRLGADEVEPLLFVLFDGSGTGIAPFVDAVHSSSFAARLSAPEPTRAFCGVTALLLEEPGAGTSRANEAALNYQQLLGTNVVKEWLRCSNACSPGSAESEERRKEPRSPCFSCRGEPNVAETSVLAQELVRIGL